MKKILQLVIVGLCISLVIWLDTLLYHFIVGLIPPTVWLGLIKVIIVILMVMYTTGISLALMALASAIALAIIDVFMPKKRSPFGNNFPPKKSRFQERLEAMAEEKKKKLNRE